MHRYRDGRAGVDSRQLFDRERVRYVIGADAAVRFGNDNPHDAGIGQLFVQLARKRMLAIPLRDVRSDLALRDFGAPEPPIGALVGEFELRTRIDHRLPINTCRSRGRSSSEPAGGDVLPQQRTRAVFRSPKPSCSTFMIARHVSSPMKSASVSGPIG